MNFNNPFQYPNAGYGLVCLRCHSSAESQHMFASLSNIEGAPEWPLQFRIDDSWRSQQAPLPPKTCGAGPTFIDLLESKAALLSQKPEEAIPPSLFPEHQKNAAIEEDLRVLPLVKLRRAPPAGS
jgi:hypothetical protein